jgi:hypothetical protein
MENLPDDFDCNNYRMFYDDLKNMTDEELKLHYKYSGIYENRIYKLNIPENFNCLEYKNMNEDLQNMSELQLKIHYSMYGIYEDRQCKNITFSNNLYENEKKENINYKSKKISIIMVHYNKKNQIILTLNQFNDLYYNKYNFEVIIVDNKSDNINNLSDIITKYKFNIKLINIEKQINYAIPYNIGLKNADGDIIILQKPEIFHCDDIIKTSIELLNNNNNYYTFPIFMCPSYEYNNKIKNLQQKKCNDYYNKFIQKINYKDFKFNYNYYKSIYNDVSNLNFDQALNHWNTIGINEKRICNNEKIYYPTKMTDSYKGWYNHYYYNKRDYHLLSVFNKKLLTEIGGFCEDLKNGLSYDGADFKYRISRITNIITVNTNKFIGIHLYHTNDNSNINNNLVELNKLIFKNNVKNNVIYCNIQNNEKINIIKNY